MIARDFRPETKAGKATLALLDALPYGEIIDELGEPDAIHTTYREGGAAWRAGDGRPLYASDDVAACQAMARCLVWRTLRGNSSLDLGSILNAVGALHPRVCNYCDVPLGELRAAVDWAGWVSRLVVIGYATWVGDYRSHYDRATLAQGCYENPAWRQFFSERSVRSRQVAIERAMYGAPDGTIVPIPVPLTIPEPEPAAEPVPADVAEPTWFDEVPGETPDA